MPCATIHYSLVAKVLPGNGHGVPLLPFLEGGTGTEQAFLHGAMGPDMGFIAGGDHRFVSDLAHYLHPADLTRNLLAEAGSAEEIAYAWGWATHVLIDVALHPLVGRACGEILRGDRNIRMNAIEDVETHVGVEVAWDALTLHSEMAAATAPRRPFLNHGNVGFVARAFETTYGRRWSDRAFLDPHRKATRLTRYWAPLLNLLVRAGKAPGRERQTKIRSLFAGGFIRMVGALAPRGGGVKGVLNPIPPPDWMLSEVEAYHTRFVGDLKELFETGAASLKNCNLETGKPNSPDISHPQGEAAQRRLGEDLAIRD